MRTLVGCDRAQASVLIDSLAVGVAVSLPWTTSATTILVCLWLVALVAAMVPAIDFVLLARVLRTPAGALPVGLVLLGIIGMAWAPVSWGERIGGLDSFPKLLAIPLLFLQFQSSPRGYWVLIGFVTSASVLLALSWYVYFAPIRRGASKTSLSLSRIGSPKARS